MTGTITKIQEQRSNQGGQFFYVFFKMEDGKSARSCVYPKFGNFARWRPFIERWKSQKEGDPSIVLTGLNLKGRMVDADSFPAARKDI